MALIKQINVGGTTYDIGVKADIPLMVSGDTLKLVLGSGLHASKGKLDVLLSGWTLESKNGIGVRVTSGLTQTQDGLSLLVSGHDSNYNRGLSLDRGMLTLRIGTGLRFNEDGTLDLAKW